MKLRNLRPGWLTRFFSKPASAITVVEPALSRQAPALGPKPALVITAEAERIHTENIAVWLGRLEAEGRRTGNPRLLQQAQNIRDRLRA